MHFFIIAKFHGNLIRLFGKDEIGRVGGSNKLVNENKLISLMYVLPIGTTVPTTESKPSGQLQIHPSVPCLWHTSPEPADMMWALTVEGAKRSGVISFFFSLQCAGHHPSGCLSSKFHVMAPPHGGLLAAKRVASQWILPPRTQHPPPTREWLSSNPKEQFPSKPASKHFREHFSGPQLCPLQ